MHGVIQSPLLVVQSEEWGGGVSLGLGHWTDWHRSCLYQRSRNRRGRVTAHMTGAGLRAQSDSVGSTPYAGSHASGELHGTHKPHKFTIAMVIFLRKITCSGNIFEGLLYIVILLFDP